MKVKLPKLVGGKTRSIPAFYRGQNTNGSPDHYESVEHANKLKAAGLAHSIHRGTAILIQGVPTSRPNIRESRGRGWRVIGQTVHNSIRPGFPRWGTVTK